MSHSLPGAGVIRLKTRSLESSGVPAPAQKARTPGRGHFIVQFDGPLQPPQLEAIERGGGIITAAVPDAAVMVSAPENTDWAALGARWIGRLAPEDKVSPLFSADLGGAGESAFLVEFHRDVNHKDAAAIIEQGGLRILEHPDLLAWQFLVLGEIADVLRLVEWDEVAYIYPASEDLVLGHRVQACEGPALEEGLLGQYARVGVGWPAGPNGLELKYVFAGSTARLAPTSVQSEILRALQEWSRHANISFIPGTDAGAPQTIAVLFARRQHGDGYAFDGPGRTLAHTFYPAPPNRESIAGDMHFDDDEEWRIGANVDLFTVALHEAGHALGLGHSDRPGAILYPYYRFAATLSDDDIAGIRSLYGSRYSPTTPAPVPPPVPTPVPPARFGITVVYPASTALTTADAILAIAGRTEGGSGKVQVSWRSDRGFSGSASGSAYWSASVPLREGRNTITITATDGAGNSASRSLAVTRQARATTAPATDTAPPALQITAPAFSIISTSAPSISIRGTASDNVGVTAVTWSNSTGGSGPAAGTQAWTADIPLQIGTNNLTIRAFDAAGNSSWRSVTAVRR